jgi:hypothetical protein
MAGTDTGASNQNMFPGFSLHDELGFLVKGGLTPLEALQCATQRKSQKSSSAGKGLIEQLLTRC